MSIFSRRAPEDAATSGEDRAWLESWAGGPRADFDEVEFVDDYAVLRWETDRGGFGLAYALHDGNGSVHGALRALRQRHRDRAGARYACVAVAMAATQVSDPYVPKLVACDMDEGAHQYETTWARLAAVLGQRAPYWFATLRDRDAIAAWQPGAPPAVVPACHVTNPIGAAADLAAAEPDGSPAAELCLHLVREIRARDHDAVTRHITELQENAAEGGDGAHLLLGAVPAELRHPEPAEPSEMVRRASWLAITERRDVVAHRVADLVQRWDGGQDWHTGGVVIVDPKACAVTREWEQRLVPANRGQAPTVLEKHLLDNAHGESDVLLFDPATGVPALRRAPGTDREDIFTLCLQRLPTRSPLAALVVSGQTSWIRTEDGTVWFAPHREGWGVGWGYSGTGCHTLAQLLGALLDDISAPAMTSGADEAENGLFELLRNTPQSGATTYTRVQLESARAS
ncbi:hypothetical protein [Streptomyces violascens]|uniref:hypothetical protein n=1 Tax=Streptomyces violascens TaxID=67381 RepID=UPI0016755E50|nr:hypothetical protein [Streptomyces violascens]GGU40456.1 hypothetical protein GCM10010289_71610 [Streptomyces violascens]